MRHTFLQQARQAAAASSLHQSALGAKMSVVTCSRVGRPSLRSSGPGGPVARKQVVQFAQALALTEQGGWSGGGQYESSAGNALQQRGISGEIQDRKSSSQEAAGDAMYVCEGVRAALATCRASRSAQAPRWLAQGIGTMPQVSS